MMIQPATRMPSEVELRNGSVTAKQLAPYQDAQVVLLMADRHLRATAGMESWALTAKRCVDYTEGRQWTEEQLARLDLEERPGLTFNKIAPLVRLVLGYHRNNRMDSKFMPGFDGSGVEMVAEALTQLNKQISQANQEPYVDTEVFLDGTLTGRGFYDQRLDFEHNDFGELRVSARDPFSIKLDPEGEEYDLNKHSFVMEDRWISIEEIEFLYGTGAAALLAPLIRGGQYLGGIPNSLIEYSDAIMPWRTFGGVTNSSYASGYQAMEAYLVNAYDRARKVIRITDCQHYIRVMTRCFVDLETGDRVPVPDHFTFEQIQKVLLYTQAKYQSRGEASPLRVQVRPLRRVKWTTIVGDLVVHDEWSPYSTFTTTGYFPYFRRGKTRGMVEDLLDPQDEVNKRRSAQIDIITRTAHSGWIYHEKGVSAEMKERIETYGAMPGINIEWKGEEHHKPEQLKPVTPPTAMEKLEEKGAADLKEISGINDSLLGQIDRVQSGRALEARQRQGVLALQIYMDNMTRSKQLVSYKRLEIVQQHYTEQRVVRTLGEDGKSQQVIINERDEAGEIVNNITLGKYTAVVNETPMAASFMAAQFEELMDLVAKGIVPIPAIQSIAIDISSLPQKEVIKANVAAFNAGQPMPNAAGVTMPSAPGQQPPAPEGGDAAPTASPPKSITQSGTGNNVKIAGNSPTASMKPAISSAAHAGAPN